MKVKKGWFAAAIVLCAAVAAMAAVVWLTQGGETADIPQATETVENTTGENGTGDMAASVFTPGYHPLRTRAASVTSARETTENGTTTGEMAGETGDVVLSDGALCLESVGAYTGDFVEDGTNDAVSDTAALVVTNTSERMLQMAEITFQVNATEQAVFVLTDIPAGARVLVLEQNRRTYRDADDYSFGRTATAYTDAGLPEESGLTPDAATAGRIAIENHSGKDYKRVFVYYKYVQTDGVYLGGITFRVPFNDLANGARGESAAGHFDPAVSRIVAITGE